MPKILVLFTGRPTATVHAVANGARNVRFSEVELMRVGPVEASAIPDHHQTLASVDEIVPYDAVVVSASHDGGMHPALVQLFEHAPSAGQKSAWQNKVGSAFMPDSSDALVDVWPALTILGTLGMLVVAPAAPGVEGATELGARVAEVVGWVTHARSHHHHAH